MACTRKSSLPHCRPSSANTASTEALSVTSQGSTSFEPDLGRQRLDALLERVALIGEGQRRALRGGRLGDAPGDRAVVGDAHDQPALALHQGAGGRPVVRARCVHLAPSLPFSSCAHGGSVLPCASYTSYATAVHRTLAVRDARPPSSLPMRYLAGRPFRGMLGPHEHRFGMASPSAWPRSDGGEGGGGDSRLSPADHGLRRPVQSSPGAAPAASARAGPPPGLRGRPAATVAHFVAASPCGTSIPAELVQPSFPEPQRKAAQQGRCRRGIVPICPPRVCLCAR